MNPITRYDPFDDFFRGFFVRPVDFGREAEAPTMKLEVREQDDQYVVHAELPGVRKEDIHVSVEGPVVSITAERRQNNEVKEGERVLRSERYFGRVARSFQLAQEVDETKASAKFNDGVLELRLPKKAQTQARKLAIE